MNPGTGELLSRTPLTSKSEVDAAAHAASQAFPAWRRTPAQERIQYLFKLRGLLIENLDDLSCCITIERGKTYEESGAELQRAIENIEVAGGMRMCSVRRAISASKPTVSIPLAAGQFYR